MKKKRSRSSPSRASLHAVPPVNFAKHGRGRANPFAARIKREGWTLVHEGPSASSIEEMPEVVAGGRPNPYAKRLKAGGIELQVGRGRALSGGATQVKSVRLPPALWKELEAEAAAQGIAVHALVRTAIVRWLNSRRVA
jgi:hypothetical protein